MMTFFTWILCYFAYIVKVLLLRIKTTTEEKYVVISGRVLKQLAQILKFEAQCHIHVHLTFNSLRGDRPFSAKDETLSS